MLRCSSPARTTVSGSASLRNRNRRLAQGALKSLAAMMDFCNSVQCRHRAIVEYFGQVLSGDSCGACDVCLGQLDLVDDPLTVGQKILSCVLRLQERFGGDYTAKVLHGSEEQRIVQQGHDQLSTWGLLSHENAPHHPRLDRAIGQPGFPGQGGRVQRAAASLPQGTVC